MEFWDDGRFLQIFCAIWFIPHIAGKIMNYNKAKFTFETAGFRPGGTFLIATVVMEIVATIGLLFGIQTIAAGVVAAFVLLGASFAVVRIDGFNWRWQKMGPEYPLFWAVICIVAGFSGSA